MIISCPSCGASFNIKTEALGTAGRTVKCSKCAHRWLAMPDGTPQELSPPPLAVPEPEPAPAPQVADVAGEQEPAALTQQLAAEDGAAARESAPEAEAQPPIPPSLREPAETGEADAQPADKPRRSRRLQPPVRKPRNSAAKVISLFVLVLLISGAASAAVFMQQKIMMWLPATQRLYAMVGLEPEVLGKGLQIVEPKPKKEVDGNDQILIVEGTVRNTSGAAIDIPLMRGALLDKQGNELHIWTFTAAKSRIAPGEMAQYRTEFRNPPADAQSLDITFTRTGMPMDNAKREVKAEDAAAKAIPAPAAPAPAQAH